MAAYNFKSFVFLVIGLLAATPSQAHAQATLLLEEPYSYDGTFAGTGHAAVYVSRVCAETPTTLRRCGPGETGVVISRYHHVNGRDWLAVPLVPYLYAVNDAASIPLVADAELVELVWVEIGSQPLADAHAMTKNVLAELDRRLATGPLRHDAPVPFFHFYGGKMQKDVLGA